MDEKIVIWLKMRQIVTWPNFFRPANQGLPWSWMAKERIYYTVVILIIATKQFWYASQNPKWRSK